MKKNARISEYFDCYRLYFAIWIFLYRINIPRIVYIYREKSQNLTSPTLSISFVSLFESVPNTAPTCYDNDNLSLVA